MLYLCEVYIAEELKLNLKNSWQSFSACKWMGVLTLQIWRKSSFLQSTLILMVRMIECAYIMIRVVFLCKAGKACGCIGSARVL